ncbi:MAG: sterol desaturase family protein [Pseudomonadota bacterium]
MEIALQKELFQFFSGWMEIIIYFVVALALLDFLLLQFVYKKKVAGEHRAILIGIFFGQALAFATRILGATGFAFIGSGLSPLDLGLSPLSFIIGFFIYEFFYWLQHWLAHVVRLFWCFHSPHHAPKHISMGVGTNHHFFEQIQMPLVIGFGSGLLGVDPAFVLIISLIDVLWGSLLHVSESVVPFRYGPLEKFLQTPSYHRAHHAKNLIYMDRNYTSITLFWDWFMGTLQPLNDGNAPEYGITRNVDTESFVDTHFGEFRALWQDLRSAENFRDCLGYLFMPPGWKPGDPSDTVSERRRVSGMEQTTAPIKVLYSFIRNSVSYVSRAGNG